MKVFLIGLQWFCSVMFILAGVSEFLKRGADKAPGVFMVLVGIALLPLLNRFITDNKRRAVKYGAIIICLMVAGAMTSPQSQKEKTVVAATVSVQSPSIAPTSTALPSPSELPPTTASPSPMGNPSPIATTSTALPSPLVSLLATVKPSPTGTVLPKPTKTLIPSKPCVQIGAHDVNAWSCLKNAFNRSPFKVLQVCQSGRWGNSANIVIQAKSEDAARQLAGRSLNILEKNINMSKFSDFSIALVDEQLKLFGSVHIHPRLGGGDGWYVTPSFNDSDYEKGKKYELSANCLHYEKQK